MAVLILQHRTQGDQQPTLFAAMHLGQHDVHDAEVSSNAPTMWMNSSKEMSPLWSASYWSKV